MLCPTDSPPELITVSGVQFATHNYDLNTGSGYSVLQNPLTPLVGAANGPFFENSRMTPASFTDGMSNTAAVSETIRSTSSSTYATDPLDVFLVTGNNSTTGPPISSDADYASLCLSLPATTTQFQATKGVRWHYGAPGHSLYNHLRPPNDKLPDCRGGLPHSTRSDPLWSWLSLNITTRSRHPGGVNTLDGRRPRSVHEELDQRAGLAGPRQPQRRRSHQLLTPIEQDSSQDPARLCRSYRMYEKAMLESCAGNRAGPRCRSNASVRSVQARACSLARRWA